MKALKELVGRTAADYVEDGMVVGLGTGSTAYWFVEEIGQRVQQGLSIVGVTTSHATAQQAERWHIPLRSVDDVPYIDVTVDGADEVTLDFAGIKGGGGALLFEKIVATHSKRNIWVVDDSKVVDYLGAFPLPVEVVRYGSKVLLQRWQQQGYQPVLRQREGQPMVTDDGNYIIDLHLGRIDDPKALASLLDHTVGVVEHGLFLTSTDTVLVGSADGVRELTR